jgi:hypothetical protein
VSESYEHLTDEDLDAIAGIVEGSARRQHGEALLRLCDEGHKRYDEQARSLLDAIARAKMAQEGEQE